ncbi:uncharacterized protein DUF1858 [Hydrogenispora ethanolica]|uniref:Uncharacterized protein DUF1858 n=1 Tax=Hydrogenispora ethanolica TaxID=1082276 RepID=A0A4R1QP97_HYDET|nr:DUF1858 domain-containing protein [Hydrogenispora ethanolica]TCL55157.1 uncharacterized protein DUF1858 [Hydrogenispora ethanolica]
MNRMVNLSKSVFEICRENPEVMEILKGLGFSDIANPGMLQTAGRLMTIPKGAAMKGISMDVIKTAFRDRGYEIEE